MAPYVYARLRENKKDIRLLTLLPGSFGDTIVVELYTALMGSPECPSYEALSYAWGSPEKTGTIRVRTTRHFHHRFKNVIRNVSMAGGSSILHGTLGVTTNLESALRHLRYPDKPRVLWIDAICIDQQLDNEKGHQVSIMADIFKNATRCIVWLGPEEDDSSHAMHLFNDIGRQVVVDKYLEECTPAADHDVDPSWANPYIMAPLDDRDLHAISSILSRPWFSRLWVRQEIAHSSEDSIILCGRDQLLWTFLKSCAFTLYYKVCGRWEQWLDQIVQRIKYLFDLFHSIVRKETDFIYAMHVAQPSLCADPRDRVYAIISFHPKLRELLWPDYSKPVLKVYSDLIVHTVAVTGSLNFLSHCGRSLRPTEFPTWTRDWRVTSPNYVAIYNSGPSWASDWTKAEIEYDASKSVLHCTGLILHRISRVWQSSSTHGQHSFPTLTSLDDLRLRECPPLNVDVRSDLTAALVRTLRINDFAESYDPLDVRYMSFAEMTKLEDTMEEFDQLQDVNRNLVQPICTNRSLFLAKDGSLGLGPLDTRPGDIVALFLGAEALFVLRPMATSSEYQLVGECYLDGYMNGEAFFGPLRPLFEPVNSLDPDHGYYWPRYRSIETNEILTRDPRLEEILRKNCSKVSPEEIKSFERGYDITPETLRKIGVPLQTISLV